MAFVQRDLLPYYVNDCSEEQHVANLLQRSKVGTQIGGALFNGDG